MVGGGGGRCWWAGRELERRGWTLPLKRRTNLILHHELCGCDVSCAATPPTSPPHPTHPHPHPPTRCRAQGEHADGGWDVHFSSQDPLHVEPSAWVVAAGPPPAGPAALHPDRHRSTAYLVAQGAMFDVSRRCGLSFVDEGLNSALYGVRAAPADILAGRFQRPPEFEPLYADLAQVRSCCCMHSRGPPRAALRCSCFSRFRQLRRPAAACSKAALHTIASSRTYQSPCLAATTQAAGTASAVRSTQSKFHAFREKQQRQVASRGRGLERARWARRRAAAGGRGRAFLQSQLRVWAVVKTLPHPTSTHPVLAYAALALACVTLTASSSLPPQVAGQHPQLVQPRRGLPRRAAPLHDGRVGGRQRAQRGHRPLHCPLPRAAGRAPGGAPGPGGGGGGTQGWGLCCAVPRCGGPGEGGVWCWRRRAWPGAGGAAACARGRSGPARARRRQPRPVRGELLSPTCCGELPGCALQWKVPNLVLG